MEKERFLVEQFCRIKTGVGLTIRGLAELKADVVMLAVTKTWLETSSPAEIKFPLRQRRSCRLGSRSIPTTEFSLKITFNKIPYSVELLPQFLQLSSITVGLAVEVRHFQGLTEVVGA